MKSTIEGIDDFREMKKWLKDHNKEERQAASKESPFKVYTHLDYTIWVGRNSKNNDLLTLKYAQKSDLWLHAKDVPGSHVVIKVQAGKKTPEAVKEYAAGIAAFYPRRKNDTLCPVICTAKKHVRKIKGPPAGAMMVHLEEEVLLVAPLEVKE